MRGNMPRRVRKGKHGFGGSYDLASSSVRRVVFQRAGIGEFEFDKFVFGNFT